ncbi:cation diffusion facilitator family transporter [Thermosporothrix hazakensis]|jgi:cation diffusion facilitator family transporter|uniref:Cation diffusion facilitator family transporter n=1 Tax=Thermosporothrix hazakensis TaxID=644383 RepID=A0A326UAA3_THEHA|nr:cation diffusion facilitator family transporter [Thermosporothrix hazakensis]PZW32064.1 cation diffusion facilitator family transporter [Thermosporothrix hazakensis]GCE49608.1 cation transporter [Thermosporothrix hazakensis]
MTARREKTIVALSSVGAAIGLTALKIIVALLTGSLGILAEAVHSALDLVTALMTFFAVRVADKPADAEHHYGHEKIENLSAFIEVVLLILTALWVVYEAVQRLFFHGEQLDLSIWAFLVMGISIIVDYSRSRALLKVARKLGSQALEADALHFSSDIWSSSVVIVGLLVVFLSKQFSLPEWLRNADALAALGVSIIVLRVSLRLARETIDALIDRAPEKLREQLGTEIGSIKDVIEIRRVRSRRAGNKTFTDLIIAAPRTFSFEQTHELSERVEKAAMDVVRRISPQGEIDIVVHVEPVAAPDETLSEQIHYLAKKQGIHVHDIHIQEIEGKLEASFDVEVQSDMDLRQAHEEATRLEQALLQQNKLLRRVTTHIEAPNHTILPRQDVTRHYTEMAQRIMHIADMIAGKGSAHDIRLYRPAPQPEGRHPVELDLVLHTVFDAHAPVSQVHIEAEEIKRALRRSYPNLGSIIIHTEPPEAQ